MSGFISSLRGIEFLDAASNRQMKYVYPDVDHWCAGWILYQNPGDGGWVTLRKATEPDISAINAAVFGAHHKDQNFDKELASKGGASVN